MKKRTSVWPDATRVEAIELARRGKSHREIAGALGKSETQVRNFFCNLARKEPAPVQPPEVSYEDSRKQSASEYWKERYSELSAKFERLNKEQTIVDQLVDDIKSLAPRSYSPAPPVNWVKRHHSRSEEQTAVLHLSDSHIGQVITPDQTDGFGDYDFDMFRARLKTLETGMISIVEQHTNTRVPKLVVAMGGDMLHGALGHAAEVGQVNTLFEQFYAGGHVLAQFLRNLSQHFPEVEVQVTAGNHTRWQNQKKMPTHNRFSNLDTFLYALTQALTKDVPAVKWVITKQPIADFEIYGHKFRMLHGDTLRGGDKALGIPNHAVGRMLSITTQLLSKVERNGPSYYLIGHFHREISIPHARGAVLFNGGFPGLDGFGLSAMFNPVDPTQRFFFVHHKYGATAQYSMSLKFAKREDASAYPLPDGSFSLS
jgi:hypothetical protein